MEVNLPEVGMPNELRQAWTKFNTVTNNKRQLSLSTLNKICALWTAQRADIFKPKNLPLKPKKVIEFERLSFSDLQKLPDFVKNSTEELKANYEKAKREAELQNCSNYNTLKEFDATLQGNSSLNAMIRIYEEGGYNY